MIWFIIFWAVTTTKKYPRSAWTLLGWTHDEWYMNWELWMWARVTMTVLESESKACIPEALIRSASLIIGPFAAERLKDDIQAKRFKLPHESTISRTRLKLDVARLQLAKKNYSNWFDIHQYIKTKYCIYCTSLINHQSIKLTLLCFQYQVLCDSL